MAGKRSGFGLAFSGGGVAVRMRPHWRRVSPLQTGRGDLAAASLDGLVYISGGLTTTVERYDPEDDSWNFVVPMAGDRLWHAKKWLPSKDLSTSLAAFLTGVPVNATSHKGTSGTLRDD